MTVLASKYFYQNYMLMSGKPCHCNTPLYHYNSWHCREHYYNKKDKIAKILQPDTEMCTAHLCCLIFLHLEKTFRLYLEGLVSFSSYLQQGFAKSA